MQYVTLYNGVKMPQLGYGVYLVGKDECEKRVLDAFETGYRHIDTAQGYYNEEEVGSAIVNSGISRGQLFITSKVWIGNYGYEDTKKSVYSSLKKLKTDYLDLMLLHQPFADYYGAWRALEDLYDEGVLKAIGVSNFYPDRLVDICCFSRIKPMVNQIELHPLNQQTRAHEWMKKYGVQAEAWSPLGRGRENIFENEVICGIAQKHGKTPAQVILRWELQRGIVVIPKSSHIERIRENFDVFDFELTETEMAAMAKLDKKQTVFSKHDQPETVEHFYQLVLSRKEK